MNLSVWCKRSPVPSIPDVFEYANSPRYKMEPFCDSQNYLPKKVLLALRYNEGKGKEGLACLTRLAALKNSAEKHVVGPETQNLIVSAILTRNMQLLIKWHST